MILIMKMLLALCLLCDRKCTDRTMSDLRTTCTRKHHPQLPRMPNRMAQPSIPCIPLACHRASHILAQPLRCSKGQRKILLFTTAAKQPCHLACHIACKLPPIPSHTYGLAFALVFGFDCGILAAAARLSLRFRLGNLTFRFPIVAFAFAAASLYRTQLATFSYGA